MGQSPIGAAAGLLLLAALLPHALEAAKELRPPRAFSVDAIEPLNGRVVLVTGGNAGIGLEVVNIAARRGATVVMACRSIDRGEQARAALLARGRESMRISVMELDLSSIASVARFASLVQERFGAVDVLVANAGVMGVPFHLTSDGFETHFAVNHLGHFMLARLLLPLLCRAADPRVVVVTSRAHGAVEDLALARLNDEREYGAFTAYARSKLASTLFANELARRMADTPVLVNSAHPGVVATDIGRHIVPKVPAILHPLYHWAQRWVLLDATEGAATPLLLAVGSRIRRSGITGRYFVPVGVEASVSPAARNATLAAQLWEFSDHAVEAAMRSQGLGGNLPDWVSPAQCRAAFSAASTAGTHAPTPPA